MGGVMASVPTWSSAAMVALGAAAGAVLRWQAGVWLNPLWSSFALGTLVVNLLGGLCIGLSLPWFARHPDENLRLLLVTGVLGGFTTFSAFSAESLLLLTKGELGAALIHTLAHVIGALGCAALGIWLMKACLS